jgi:3',5'-cyclic AMP phosphodiesterase CpdA
MRVLHLSDLHAPAADDADQREIVEAVLEDVTAMDREIRIEVVVFSGDLGADGTAATFQSGKTLLLEPLKERLPSRPIVIVPGNHECQPRPYKQHRGNRASRDPRNSRHGR